MTDIAAFLTARLDEDEQLAREAEYSSGGGTWLFEGPPSDGKSRPGQLKLGDGPWLISDPELRSPTVGDNFDGHQMEHIARHDPASVLADIAAKRKLLTVADGLRETAADTEAWGLLDVADEIERTLAAVHADRPDYDEKWRR